VSAISEEFVGNLVCNHEVLWWRLPRSKVLRAPDALHRLADKAVAGRLVIYRLTAAIQLV
jgi:hypothetical protein